MVAVVAPQQVGAVAAALGDFELSDDVDDDVADSLNDLTDFYASAADRGHAVVIVYN